MLALELVPAVALGLARERVARTAKRWPQTLRIVLPVLCALPYVLISISHRMFLWRWFAVYAVLPIAVAWLLARAAAADPEQHGNWRDAIFCSCSA